MAYLYHYFNIDDFIIYVYSVITVAIRRPSPEGEDMNFSTVPAHLRTPDDIRRHRADGVVTIQQTRDATGAASHTTQN